MSKDLIDLFAETLRLDKREIGEHSSPTNLPRWDSVEHMQLVCEIEAAYSVAITSADVARMTSVGATRLMLREKGVEGI